jgi:DNA-directed RNA polymerase specialized sigma24 family protein
MAIRRQEDISDFSELVAARSGALFRTAFVVVGDHQLAQDLLQEALVKAYVAWPRLRDTTKAEAYVRRTIVTTAI